MKDDYEDLILIILASHKKLCPESKCEMLLIRAEWIEAIAGKRLKKF